MPGLTCPPWPPRIQTKEQDNCPRALAPPFSLLAASLLLLLTSSNIEQPVTLSPSAFRTAHPEASIAHSHFGVAVTLTPTCRALRYARRSLPGPPFACRTRSRQQHSFAAGARPCPFSDPHSIAPVGPQLLAHPPHTLCDHVGAAVPSWGEPTASAPQLWLP